MKKAIGLLLVFMCSLPSLKANTTTTNTMYSGNAYVFIENGVAFSVYPDGQFDFIYLGNQYTATTLPYSPYVNISFNSGYNYDHYVQFDAYGAILQIETVPIYYDYYGRIIQAGNVHLQYNYNQLVAIGGLYIHYDFYGNFAYTTGFINRYNTHYIYYPWFRFYSPPPPSHCIVYHKPYRRYYRPVRYSYNEYRRINRGRNNSNYNSGRHNYRRPGSGEREREDRIYSNQNTRIARTERNNKSTTTKRKKKRTNTKNETQLKQNAVATTRSPRNNQTRGSRSSSGRN